jgi:hypothetical protein
MENIRQFDNNESLQYYTNMITSPSTPVDIWFNGLIRGRQYFLKCLITSTHAVASQKTTIPVSLMSVTKSDGNSTVFTVPSTVSTQCVSYNFTSNPGNSTKTALINYCQNQYSANGWSNGCVVCTDSDVSYMAPGLPNPTNTTCRANSTTTLRNLQGNSGNANENANENAKVNYTVLTLCPVPSPICSSDFSNGGKGYTDMITTLSGLNTASALKSALNIDNLAINTTSTSSDSTNPNITQISYTVDSPATQSGTMKFTVKLPAGATPLVCYWQIASTAPASFQALMSCTGNLCGKTKVNSNGSQVSVNANAFSYATNYNVYIGCVNDIPGAQRQTAVTPILTPFSFTEPSKEPVKNQTCKNGTLVVNNQTDCSAGFITYGFYVIMMMLALLFN